MPHELDSNVPTRRASKKQKEQKGAKRSQGPKKQGPKKGQ
jgi:hypothetical protein